MNKLLPKLKQANASVPTGRVHLSKVPVSAIQYLNANSESAANFANYHFRMKVISRSDHRCVLHCVAYRSACEMLGGDGNSVADYSRRKGVIYCEIVAPKNCPSWVRVRNSLWIEAAKAEKRKNSIEAREIEVTIPFGLASDDAAALAREFAVEVSEKHGIVVDFSLHLDARKDWSGLPKNHRGYHVHFLLTTRRLGALGFEEKSRELDLKTSGLVRYWRSRWQELANTALEKNGLNQRIDHRSNAARGIQRSPTKYLGPKVVAMERRGIKTDLGNLNRSIINNLGFEPRTSDGPPDRSTKDRKEESI